MTPETINLIIGFGGVALIGVVMFAVAWILGAAAQGKEPPSQTSEKPDTPPLAR